MGESLDVTFSAVYRCLIIICHQCTTSFPSTPKEKKSTESTKTESRIKVGNITYMKHATMASWEGGVEDSLKSNEELFMYHSLKNNECKISTNNNILH